MGDGETYQSFLEWGLTNYPAKKTGVIVVSHGSFTAGYCFDEYEEFIVGKNRIDRLQNTECEIATKNALKNTNSDKLEFIAYSVCLIQGQDLAYKNKDCYKYMLASQEQLLIDSFNYDVWLKDLFEYKDTVTILKSMVDSFFEEVNPLYIEHNEDNLETLSILDLSYMESYKITFENMAQYLDEKLDFETKCYFFGWFDENVYHFSNIYPTNAMFDVYDFLNKVEGTKFSPRKEDIDNLKSILDDMIVYNRKGPEAGEANGLSLYFSLSPDFYYKIFEHNTDFKNWNKLIDY